MKKVLVIDESPLFRDYLAKKLGEFGFGVVLGINGLDGSIKLRKETPDLVIMDYYLSRVGSPELLAKKKADPNTAPIPVIMVSSKVDRDKIRQVGQYNVRKFFTKPVKVDGLLKAVAELLNTPLNIDDTPCILEAHYNDQILFVEIAQGLNREKIELLRYKIAELIDLYEVTLPKVLVMMSSIDITSEDSLKLASLFTNLIEGTRGKKHFVKVLTNSSFVKGFLQSRAEYADIEVTNSLEKAMDGLLGRRTGNYLDTKSKTVHEGFLQAATPKKGHEESIHLRFEQEIRERTSFDFSEMGNSVHITVVDDDTVIQELIKTAFSDTKFQIATFDNGKDFVADRGASEADLIFLDLMMPEMDGFQVMEELSSRGVDVPIIVLSALSQRETVLRALKYGVRSYMIKPLKPEGILRKAAEVLRLSF